jgi:glycosyltransferase involved in cell wall biosynthesis
VRIAFLCKRRYMGKDVIADRYARLYEIPYQLARMGHDVRGFCFSYQGHDDGEWTHDASPGSLVWQSRSVGRLYLPALATYPGRMLRRLRSFAPDIVIGASDIPHVALGAWLARRLRRPFVADLYDNFEGFGQARIPGMVPMLRRAARDADLVLTTSELLRELVVDTYRARGEVVAMPSSVDKAVFWPRDKQAARKALGLPVDAQLIGTAGGLYRDKGIDSLYQAWPRLAEANPNLHLVLAGPVEPGTPHPEGPRVHYLGAMPHERVAELFSALDVGVMCILDTPFGRYCFPQKAYEMLACGLPVVAADVGAMAALLAQTPQSLYQTGNAKDLADKVSAQLTAAVRPDLRIDDWQTLIADIEPKLLRLVRDSNTA